VAQGHGPSEQNQPTASPAHPVSAHGAHATSAALAAAATARSAPKDATETPVQAAALAAAATVRSATKEQVEAPVQAVVAARQAARADASLDTSTASAPQATAWPAAAPRLHDATRPFQAELKAAVGSNQFAPALGTQLSVLVRDGIEHAQLKLNPADMGPIEVRISLDGSQAQVDFSAAHAATRQALQDAVPALASALRESGLTLTGGGVFEQPREQRGDARQAGPRGAARSSDSVPGTVSPGIELSRMARARGVVDLYA
jgi:flagellar hook-length control protein FliK